MTHKGWRSWLAFIASLLLLFSSIPQAFAADASLSSDPDITMLQQYRIVLGDTNGDLRLDSTITRAEAATIFVRTMGGEDLAKLLNDTTEFNDMDRHPWAVGYVTMASRMKLMKGRGNGVFDPGANITNAEVMTVILRMVGHEPTGPWNPQVIMNEAARLGFAPDGPIDMMANLPAYRGPAFKSLSKAISTVTLSDGSTVLRKYVAKTAPTLTVDSVPATTVNSSVTITGTSTGAKTVTVNGQAATLTGTRFSATVNLTGGTNNLVVEAKDWAGNTTSKTVTITRSSTATRIDVTGNTVVKPGETTNIKATAYDSAGRALPADLVTASVSGSVGTYDAATGVFKAGNTPGKATLTFTSGTVTKAVDVIVGTLSSKVTGLHIVTPNGESFTVRKNTTVQVQAIDDMGNVVAEDQGRQVMLAVSGLTGVTVTPNVASTINGIATFTVTGTASGDGTMTAISTGVESDLVDVFFGSGTRVVLISTKSTVSANGVDSADIRAVLQDENGSPVTNSSDSDITIDLSASTREAYLSDRYVTIRRGTSASTGYDDGTIIAGSVTETVKVNGTISSSQKYAVVPVTVSFSKITTGSATQLQIVGGGGTYNPNTNGTVHLTVKAVDSNGNLVTDTSYAFQVQVSTSNNEALRSGVPDGLSLELGNTGMTPITTATESEVVARTENGTADLYLTYNKSGDVTLKLVGVNTTNDALDDSNVEDVGTSSRNLTMDDRTVHYAGAVDHFKLVADLPSLRMTDQPAGILKTGGTSGTIKAVFVDANGGRVTSYNGYVTMALTEHTGTGTRLSTSERVRASGGVASFTIASTSNVDVDTWDATANVNGTDKTETISVATYSQAPSQYAIPTIRSMASETGDEERVGINDSYLRIEVGTYSEIPFGYVKVFKSGGSLIYTSDIMDMATAPFVDIPKDDLAASDKYYVKVSNGVGDSTKSDTWPTAILKENPLTIDVTSVTFDAITGELKANGSGIVANSSGGRIDPSRLNLHVASDTTRTHDVTLDDLGASVDTCVTSSGSFKCTLTSPLPPSIYNGTVTLETQSGWYYRTTNGDSAKADEDLTDNVVTPMAYVTSASVSFGLDSNNHVTGTLYLNGVDLDASKIYLHYVSVGGIVLSDSTTKYVSNTNSTMVTITLPSYNDLPSSSRQEANSIAYKIKNLPGPITVDLDEGWLVANAGTYRNAAIDNIPLYAKNPIVTVKFRESDNTLVFTGKGFEGGSVDMSQLVIKTRTGTQVVDLSSYPVAGTLTDDTSFTVTISNPTDVTALKANKGNLYLVSDPATTSDSWYMNNGLAAEQLTGRTQPVGWLTY
jgi:hypothetical protein